MMDSSKKLNGIFAMNIAATIIRPLAFIVALVDVKVEFFSH